MRAGLGIVSLLIVLALVALLTRKNMETTRVLAPAVQAAPTADGAPAPTPTGNVRQQSQQIQQQYKASLEKALNQPRPEPAD